MTPNYADPSYPTGLQGTIMHIVWTAPRGRDLTIGEVVKKVQRRGYPNLETNTILEGLAELINANLLNITIPTRTTPGRNS